MTAALFILLTYILFFLTCVVRYTSFHLRVDLQIESFYQILFNLQMGMEGGEDVWMEAIQGFFSHYGASLAIMGLLAGIAIFFCLKNGIKVRRLKKQYRKPSERMRRDHKAWLTGSIAGLVMVSFLLGAQSYPELQRLGYFRYMEIQNSDSNFYQANFVSPNDVKITFPENKKNLVYIFMESMERSFADQEHGGFYDENMIPELTELSLTRGEDFGNGVELNGATTTEGATWTAAALVTQTTGSPLVYVDPHDGDDNAYWDSTERPFLKNLPALGNILEENGYNNSFICGSIGTYAGRQNFFEQHGDYEFYDLVWAQENGVTPTDDYHVFWGMEDFYLFDVAKDIIEEEAAKDEPFNVTMLTVDTHFPKGNMCKLCRDDSLDGLDQLKHVVSCSDHQVTEFVDWIYDQPFGEDTVVILAGDHYNMSSALMQELNEYDRQIYFTVINGPEYYGREKKYATIDLFPTTVAALGATIEGNRLGLGTNLYSNEFTLLESLGLDYLDEQIPAASGYYVRNILGVEDNKTTDHDEQ